MNPKSVDRKTQKTTFPAEIDPDQQFHNNPPDTSEYQRWGSKVLHAQEAERHWIHRQLHDEIGQALTAAIMELEFWRDQSVPPSGRDAAVNDIRRALGQVRELSSALRPHLLDNTGLEAATRWYLNRQSAVAGFSFTWSVTEILPRSDSATEMLAFRIIEAAVDYLVQYQHVEHIELVLVVANEQLTFRIGGKSTKPDNGALTNTVNADEHLHLFGVREQVRIAGGSFDIAITADPGALITGFLPFSSVKNCRD